MKLGKILTTIILILIIISIAFSEIDTVMKTSASMLILIYCELVDISEKLDQGDSYERQCARENNKYWWQDIYI